MITLGTKPPKKRKKKKGAKVRDARTGKYVDKGAAKRRPHTTVRETE